MKVKKMLLSKRFMYKGIDALEKKYHNNSNIRNLIDCFYDREKNFNQHLYCPCCKSRNKTVVLVSEVDRNGFPDDLIVCEQCKLMFSLYYMNNDFSNLYYKKYSNILKGKCLDGSDEYFKKKVLNTSFAEWRFSYIEKVLSETNINIKNIIEVGCSDGVNLIPFNKRNIDVLGIDYDEYSVDLGRKHGLNLTTQTLDDIVKSGLKFDLVYLSHVLEHIGMLDDFLNKLKKIMHQHSVLYVEVPGLRQFLKYRKNINVSDQYPGSNDLLINLHFEHNYFFDALSLSSFMNNNGFIPYNINENIQSLWYLKKDDEFSEKALSRSHYNEDTLSYCLSIEKERSQEYCRNFVRKIFSSFH